MARYCRRSVVLHKVALSVFAVPLCSVQVLASFLRSFFMHDDFSLFTTVISCLAMRENREKNLLRGFTSTETIKDNLPEECKKRMFRLGEYQRSSVAKRNFAFDLKGGPWYFGVNAQPRLDVICNSFCFYCKMTNGSFC